MSMAAAIPTSVAAGADSGGQCPIAAAPGAGVSQPASDAASAAAAGSMRSWSSFLEALGVAGTDAVEGNATTVLTSSTASPQPGVAEDHGSPLSARVFLNAHGKVPGSPAGPLPGGTQGSEKPNRVRGIQAAPHQERKLKAGDGASSQAPAAGVGGDASAIAAMPAPVSTLRQFPRENCAIGAGHRMGGDPKEELGIAERWDMGPVPRGGQTSGFPATSRSVEGSARDASLPTANNREQPATAAMGRKESDTAAVAMPSPVPEEARTLSQSTGVVNNPVTSIDTYPPQHFAARKAEAVEATSANNSLKTARPSNAASVHGSKSGRLDLANEGLNQERPIGVVQQQWNGAGPSHTPNELTGVGYRPGSNLSGLHPEGSMANDTFAAIDAERTASPPTWIHAGTHRAEAGYLDPALGWVGVRADAAGNGVHAALVPGSGEAAQVLGSHLAGLNTYLLEHHGQSATVTLIAPENAMPGTGSGTGAQTGQDHPARGDTNQGKEEWRGKQVAPGSEPGTRERSHGHAATTTGIPKPAGEYISVMA